MLYFACPQCRTILKAAIDKVEKLFKCPKCGAVVRAPKSVGQLAPLEFAEEAEPDLTTVSPPPPVRRDDFLPTQTQTTYMPDLTPDWSGETRQTNLRMFLAAALIVASFAMILTIVLIVTSQGDKEKKQEKVATARPRQSERLRPPPPQPAPRVPRARPPVESTSPPEPVPEVPRDGTPPPKAVGEAPPKEEPQSNGSNDAEIEQDHELVLQYVRLNISKNSLKNLQWKGPWRAVDGRKEGKLYRLRTVMTFLNANYKSDEKLLGYYFFLYDDAVARHQPDPGDLEKLTICKVPDPKPLIATSPSPAMPTKRDSASANEPATPVPGRLLKETVSGYETRLVRGFSVLLSTQAVAEAKKDNGRPFGALEVEFAGLEKALSPRALKVLRNVRIWVEWDNVDRRNPDALAKYYGGNIWRLDPYEHPLKANSVVLLSLRRLAVEKNGAVHRTRLVLLHELSHAVHYLLIGYDNRDVKFAYRQAMDRRLYDQVPTDDGTRTRAYAATNEHEYFAELSCAYLDRCRYFPFTLEDLKEHDPTGFRLMQAVWGKRTPSKDRTE